MKTRSALAALLLTTACSSEKTDSGTVDADDALWHEAMEHCGHLLSAEYFGTATVTAVEGDATGISAQDATEGELYFFTAARLSEDRTEDAWGHTGWPVEVGGLFMEFTFGAFYIGDHTALLEYWPGDESCTLTLDSVYTWQRVAADPSTAFWMWPPKDGTAGSVPNGTFQIERESMRLEGDWTVTTVSTAN